MKFLNTLKRVLVSASLFAFCAGNAAAYSCFRDTIFRDFGSAYERADLVFEGMIISSEDIRENDEIMDAMTWTYGAGVEDRIYEYRRSRILIINRFKGDETGIVDVWTGWWENDWEQTGDRRMIFLRKSASGHWIPSICGYNDFTEERTRSLLELDGDASRAEYLDTFQSALRERPLRRSSNSRRLD